MAVTITKTVYATINPSGSLGGCLTGGEDYRTVDAGETVREWLFGQWDANLSLACKPVSVALDYKARIRTTSNTITASSGETTNSLYLDATSATKGGFSFSNYNQLKHTIGSSSDYANMAKQEVRAGTGSLEPFPCGNTIYFGVYMSIHNTAAFSKLRFYFKDVKFTIVRTRACYITFKGDGITDTTTMYDYGTVPSYGSTPTREGYIFKGWNNGTTTYTGTLPTAYETDVTYTAVWAANYTVTYDVNGATSGAIANATAYRDTDFALPTGLKKQYTVTFNPNYTGANNVQKQCSATFNGWEDHGSITGSDNKTYSGSVFDAPFYANNYSDLYGAFKYNKQSLVNHWINNGLGEGRSCTGSTRGVYSKTNVVSNLADGFGTASLKAQWSNVSAVDLPVAGRGGYTFLGWYTSAFGGTKVGDGGASYTPAKNVTLYAHWAANETTDIYLGTSVLDVYIGTSKMDVHQGTKKIYG